MTQCERLGGLLNYYYRSGQNNRFFRRYETEDRRDEPHAGLDSTDRFRTLIFVIDQ